MNDVDVNWIFGDSQIKATLFGAVSGRIGKVCLVGYIFKAPVIPIAEFLVIARQIETRYEHSVCISFAFLCIVLLNIPLLLPLLPLALRFADHAHVTTLHRPAKQKISPDTTFRALSRPGRIATR